jgi:hypothetical protein
MRIRGSRRLGALALTCACALWLHGQEKKDSGQSVRVQVNYTGSGTVDEGHKIYVALWDTPNFIRNEGTPVAVKSTASNSGEVTFSGVAKSPVYVSTAFDPTGKWDAHSAPPAGSSLGMYSKSPGQPEPIALSAGQTAQVQISFDDSVKVK